MDKGKVQQCFLLKNITIVCIAALLLFGCMDTEESKRLKSENIKLVKQIEELNNEKRALQAKINQLNSDFQDKLNSLKDEVNQLKHAPAFIYTEASKAKRNV